MSKLTLPVKEERKQWYKLPKNLKDQGGYMVNWNKVDSYMDLLDIPKNVYRYDLKEFYDNDWFNILSVRSRGKTTNIILPIIILHLMYGQTSIYLRTDERDLKTAFISNMFNVIISNKYIEKLSGGKYNHIKYDNKNFYLCKREDGEIKEIAETSFMMVLSINMNEDIKSTLNLPNCYIALFDEYLKQKYPFDGFYNLCNIIDTIRRTRIDFKIVMPSNLVNPYSPWFEEMDIREAIDEIRMGEVKHLTLNGGARMYLEYVSDKEDIKEDDIREAYNMLTDIRKRFFGFSNSRLNSITGGGKWEIKQYPHLHKKEKDEERRVLDRDVYIHFGSYWICLEYSWSDKIGFYINARLYSKGAAPIEERNIRVYVLTNPRKDFEAFGTGCNSFDNMIWALFDESRFFYSTNEVGRMVEEFIQDAKDKIYT